MECPGIQVMSLMKRSAPMVHRAGDAVDKDSNFPPMV